MKYFSVVVVLLLPIGTAAALGRDNANDETSTTANLSHIPRQLRGNQMLAETDFPNSDMGAETLPSNEVTPNEGSVSNSVWPAPTAIEDEGNGGERALAMLGSSDSDKQHRSLGGGTCSIFAEGNYFDPVAGGCYNLGRYWWNDRITHIRSSSNTCIEVWEHENGGIYKKYCGANWLTLDGTLSKKVSRVCCATSSGSGPAPAPTPTPGQGPTPSGIDGDWLSAHNSRRTQYFGKYGKGAMDLKWSNSLKASAQDYANKLIQIGGGDMCHIEHGYQGDRFGGENLAAVWGGTSGSSPDQVLKQWYDNEINLPYGQNGHATQVVYRSSRYVGCGIAEKGMNGGGKCFIQVCRYLAPGNCNINANNWVAKTLQDAAECGPACPSEGCF